MTDMEESTERMENGALLRHRLKTLEMHQEKMDAKLDQIRESLGRILAGASCPKPGLCMDLESVVRKHAEDIGSIKNSMAWVKGAAWSAGFIGGVVSALGSLVLQHFTRLG